MSADHVRFAETGLGRIACRVDGDSDGIRLLFAQRYRATLDDWNPRFVAALPWSRRDISILRFIANQIAGALARDRAPERRDGVIFKTDELRGAYERAWRAVVGRAAKVRPWLRPSRFVDRADDPSCTASCKEWRAV